MKLCGWEVTRNQDILDFFTEHQKTGEPIEYADATASLSPDHTLEVGTVHDFKRVFTPGSSGVEKGDTVVFAFPRSWTRPQDRDENMPGFVSAQTGGEQLDITLTYAINLEWYVQVSADRDMDGSDAIELAYKNVRIQRFAQHTWDNWRNNMGVFICRNDFEEIYPLEPDNVQRPLVITNGPPAQVRMMVPVPVVQNEEFTLKISFLDRFNNEPDSAFEGTLRFSTELNIINLPEQVSITSDDNNYTEVSGLVCETTCAGFIQADSDGPRGRSNLVLCRENAEERVFFGDIHAHTAVSDGLGSPAELCRHARYVALSDVCSVTDHNHRENATVDQPLDAKISPGQWQEILSAVNDADTDNEFVALPAVEEPMNGFGHRNIYFPTPPDVLFQGEDVPALYEYLDEHAPDALVIPHHTLEICRSTDFDPRYVPLIEIYSMWGSSEERYGTFWSKNIDRGISVMEILNNGHRLGIVGGSDCHHGKPDIAALPSRFTNMCYSAGITAFMSSELTRQGIFNAMRNKKTYATTGQRIYLSFRVNGNDMGEEVPVPDSNTIDIEVTAGGTDDIRRIDIVKNGELFAVHEGTGFFEEISYTDTAEEGDFYYVRLMQIDNAMAWSSPIWMA